MSDFSEKQSSACCRVCLVDSVTENRSPDKMETNCHKIHSLVHHSAFSYFEQIHKVWAKILPSHHCLAYQKHIANALMHSLKIHIFFTTNREK